ncbi:MAG TPA: alpha/beta hydrolase-fold protein [Coleofasciculaceae cyanobacterium]|jgi:enterochelin esterase-like enzyme
MKYKQAGIIGAAFGLAITGWACSKIVSTNAQQTSDAPTPVIQPSTSPPSDTQLNVPQPTDAPLTYKIETYNSRTMGKSRTYGVVLPPGYESSPTQQYPVVFLLHGGHGTPTSWFENEKGAAVATLQKLYAEGKLPPSIIITPDGNDKRGTSRYWDPQYIDGPNGKVVTAVGDELVKVIQSRYRTLPTPNFWAIGGLSSGGWGAINVGLHNRNNFSILFSHSGYFQDKSGPNNSPINFVKKLSTAERERLRIYLDAGKQDNFSLTQNRQFRQVLNQLKISNVVHEFPGEHSWRYWREHLADSLTFVGEQFGQAQGAQAQPLETQGVDEAKPPQQ